MDARGEQLKGCPFCGSDNVSICMDCGRHHFKCHCCGMMFEFSADTKTELIRKWNRRAQPLERAEAAEADGATRQGGRESGGGEMKRLLLIAITAALTGCDLSYDHHPEVLTAMRDPLFDQWLKRNNLELISTDACLGCTCLHVAFVGGKGEAKR